MDPTGTSGDGSHANPIVAGQTRPRGEVQGPGNVTDWWLSSAARERDRLKKGLLRIDGYGAAEREQRSSRTVDSLLFSVGFAHLLHEALEPDEGAWTRRSPLG